MQQNFLFNCQWHFSYVLIWVNKRTIKVQGLRILDAVLGSVKFQTREGWIRKGSIRLSGICQQCGSVDFLRRFRVPRYQKVWKRLSSDLNVPSQTRLWPDTPSRVDSGLRHRDSFERVTATGYYDSNVISCS